MNTLGWKAPPGKTRAYVDKGVERWFKQKLTESTCDLNMQIIFSLITSGSPLDHFIFKILKCLKVEGTNKVTPYSFCVRVEKKILY